MYKKLSNILFTVSALVLVVAVSACDQQSRGFALPPGDAEAGRAMFIHLNCTDCHSVANDIEKYADGNPEIEFELGGPTSRVVTYGDLVTSIINPSHKISGSRKALENTDAEGQSNMRNYNQVMTVQELIDLTTYLESAYEVIKPQYTPHYYGP